MQNIKLYFQFLTRSKWLVRMFNHRLFKLYEFVVVHFFISFNELTFHQAKLSEKLFLWLTIWNSGHLVISVTRFGKISPLCQNFKSLWAIFWMFYLVFGKLLSQLWHFYATVQIAIVVNGNLLNHNIAIWSHCWWWKRARNSLLQVTTTTAPKVFKLFLPPATAATGRQSLPHRYPATPERRPAQEGMLDELAEASYQLSRRQTVFIQQWPLL